MVSKKPEVTIIIPCLNEEEAIDFCLAEIRKTIQAHTLSAEVIAVDNGSTDKTLERLQNAQASFADSSTDLIILEEKQRGYGRAYLRGLQAARGTYIFMADADGTYDFSDIPRFLEQLRHGSDIVVGNRFSGSMRQESMPMLHRYVGNPLLSLLVRWFFSVNIHDIHCGARALRASALKKITLYSGGMEFASEMVIKAARRHLQISEIPITYRPRIGQSKLRTFNDGWRHLRFILLYSPLFLFFLPGIGLFTLGTLSMIVLYFTNPMLFGIQFYFHPLFLSSVLIILGYQLMFFAFFSKIYAITHFGDEHKTIENLFRIVTIERAGVVGIIIAIVGASMYGIVFIHWAKSSFSSLDQTKNLIVALTMLVLGIQTFFSAFMLSTVGIKEK